MIPLLFRYDAGEVAGPRGSEPSFPKPRLSQIAPLKSYRVYLNPPKLSTMSPINRAKHLKSHECQVTTARQSFQLPHARALRVEQLLRLWEQRLMRDNCNNGHLDHTEIGTLCVLEHQGELSARRCPQLCYDTTMYYSRYHRMSLFAGTLHPDPNLSRWKISTCQPVTPSSSAPS